MCFKIENIKEQWAQFPYFFYALVLTCRCLQHTEAICSNMQFILILCIYIYIDFFQASLLSRISMTLVFIYIYTSISFVRTCSVGPSSGLKKKKSGSSCLKVFGIPAATKTMAISKKTRYPTPRLQWIKTIGTKPRVTSCRFTPRATTPGWRMSTACLGSGWTVQNSDSKRVEIALKPLMNQSFRSLFFFRNVFLFCIYIYIVCLFRSVLFSCMYILYVCSYFFEGFIYVNFSICTTFRTP